MSTNFSSPQYSTETSARFSCKLESTRIAVGEEVRLQVKNTGQTSASFTVKIRSRGIKFSPRSSQAIELRPGQSEAVIFSLRASGSAFIGSKADRPFRILVQSSKGETQILKGKIRSQAILSPIQALISFLLLFFVFFISRKAQGADGFSLFPTDTPTPTITPLPTFTPTPAPHAGEVLYLTFDDGPSLQWTGQILGILAKYDAKATFFIIGKKAKEHPELILAAEKAGHSIAHHGWSHTSLNGIGFDAFANEIYLTNTTLPNGALPCIRLPYADEGYFSEDHAEALGLEIIWWDVDPLDWSSPGQDYIEATVLAEASDGSIILLHDGGGYRAQTVAALERILAELSAQGYRFDVLCR
jgi:peptidoglycan/xylan/chitin deacetylase (PgdA/CDA1 family)